MVPLEPAVQVRVERAVAGAGGHLRGGDRFVTSVLAEGLDHPAAPEGGAAG